MLASSLYRDYDALAHKPKSLGEKGGAINHVKKAKKRQKGVEVVFDPKAHREFVTGFRKRKQQRRKAAEKQIVRKSKEQRVQERAERRKEMKQQLGLPDDYGVHDSDSEEEGPPPIPVSEVKRYEQGGFVTTVKITSINAGYSDDEEPPGASGDIRDTSEDGDDNEEDHEQPQQQEQLPQPQPQHQQQQQPQRKLKAAVKGQAKGLKKTKQGKVHKQTGGSKKLKQQKLKHLKKNKH